MSKKEPGVPAAAAVPQWQPRALCETCQPMLRVSRQLSVRFDTREGLLCKGILAPTDDVEREYAATAPAAGCSIQRVTMPHPASDGCFSLMLCDEAGEELEHVALDGQDKKWYMASPSKVFRLFLTYQPPSFPSSSSPCWIDQRIETYVKVIYNGSTFASKYRNCVWHGVESPGTWSCLPCRLT
jgi:hypothetical protein